MEKIAKTALKVGELTVTGQPHDRHADLMEKLKAIIDTAGIEEARESMRKLYFKIQNQGFITNHGRYVDRKEAWQIAVKARQIKHNFLGESGKLYSENLF
jgi:hypothetical protein